MKVIDVKVGFHPEGYRIDKTASVMDFYTRWKITAVGGWGNPKPTCFRLLPKDGWFAGEVEMKDKKK